MVKIFLGKFIAGAAVRSNQHLAFDEIRVERNIRYASHRNSVGLTTCSQRRAVSTAYDRLLSVSEVVQGREYDASIAVRAKIYIRQGDSMRASLSTAALILGCLFGSSSATAQDVLRFDQKYADSIKEQTDISKVGVNEFGERLNLQNGSVSFQWTDIDIPGNNNLPVRLQRTLTIEDKSRTDELAGFGEFGSLDLPYMTGIYTTNGWQVDGANPNGRCSDYNPPVSLAGISYQDYWNGNSMHIPWAGDQMLLKVTPGTVPQPAGAAPIMTKDFWAFKCTAATNYPGEGFVAISPQGEKYYFDYAITKNHAGLSKRYGNYGVATATMSRLAVYFMVSRIEDRFGNFVTYSYTNDKLSSISSSDGRFISIEAWDGDKVTRVSSGAGTWNYSYAGRTMTVTLPDNSTWTYTATGELRVEPTPNLPLYEGNIGPNGPRCPVPEMSEGAYNLAVKHPAGATATYDFIVERHGISNVPRLCNSYIDNGLMSYRYLTIPNFNDSLTLQSKSISGPGLQPLTWNYEIGSGSLLAFEDVCADPPTELACRPTSETLIYGPNGVFERYTFGTLYKVNFGQLVKEEKGLVKPDSSIEISRVIEREYMSEQEVAQQPFPNRVGAILNNRLDDISSAKLRPLKRQRILQDQSIFETRYSTFDSLARPTTIVRGN